jgi:protein O-mannosyl-transferase
MSASAAKYHPARGLLATPSRSAAGWPAALIVAAGIAAYGNSLGGSFVYDDRLAILNNPTIQHGWLAALLPPNGGATVAGRPLANLTFALNYELSGYQVWSYHVVNLAIHLLAGLVLFGLVRRTLELPGLPAFFAGRAMPVALAAALLWVLHPLQTDAVTYLVQRVESLMGLFYLLTLYCFVRALTASPQKYWLAGSVAACLLGMFCKEVMVTAPLMLLLFDRTFEAGTFAEAWRRRGKYYGALAATWLPLTGLVWGAGNRGGSAGFHLGLAWTDYAWSQFPVVARYLTLAAWPHPQMVDYGPAAAWGDGPVAAVGGAVGAALLIVALVAGTIYLLWARPALGFLGAWFFIILAPSSSIIPVATEVAAEHRLYLSLAALAVLAAVGLARCAGPRVFTVAVALWAVVLGGLTFERNEVYRTEMGNYFSIIENAPENDRAFVNLGVDLADAGRLPEAAQAYVNALWINPRAVDAEHNLGLVLERQGHPDQAILHYRNALRLSPDYIPAHAALANILVKTKATIPEAITEFAALVRLQPDSAGAHLNLGKAYIVDAEHAQFAPALAQFQIAARLAPDEPEAFFALGDALTKEGIAAPAGAGAPLFTEAVAQYSLALKIKPDYARARGGAAYCLMRLGRYGEAVSEYQAALRFDPTEKSFLAGLALAQGLQAGTITPPP